MFLYQKLKHRTFSPDLTPVLVHIPQRSYDVNGPFASLRMKHWRRGLQDADYLMMATAKDAPKVKTIVDRMVPKALWEYGVNDVNDPTWVRADISWSTNPDDWEAARKELAEIIEGL